MFENMDSQYPLGCYWLQGAGLELRTNVFHYKIIWKVFFSQAAKLLIGHLLLVINKVTTSYRKIAFMLIVCQMQMTI